MEAQHNFKRRSSSLMLLLYAIALFSIGTLIVLRINSIGGYYWDFIAHMLFAKALISPAFYSDIVNHSIANAILYENMFYVEWFRAPLMSVFMAPFLLLGSDGPLIYVAAELAVFIIATIYAADAIGANRFLMLTMLLTPYVVIYLTLLNGAEILSMALLLFGIGLAAKGKWQAGILLSLAGLAKYFSAIFILLLFLLPKGQKRKGFAAYIGVLAIWLAANYAVYGNPIESYLQSLYEVFIVYKVSTGSVIGAIIQSFSIILPYILPFAVAAIALALYVKIKKISNVSVKTEAEARKIYVRRIIIASFFIAVTATALVSVHASINSLPRWGYEIYACLALLLGVIFSDIFTTLNKHKELIRIGIAITALLYLALLVVSYAGVQSHYPFASYGTKNYTLTNAVSEINGLSIAKCNIVSNAWVYLRYYGIKAHYPSYVNSSMHSYPAVVFDTIGIANSSINVTEYSSSVKGNGYRIYLPKNNFSCT